MRLSKRICIAITLFLLITASCIIIYLIWQNRTVIYGEDIEIRECMNKISMDYIGEEFKLTDEALLENEAFKVHYKDGELTFENKKSGENVLLSVRSPKLKLFPDEHEYYNVSQNFNLRTLYNPFYERFLYPSEIIQKDNKNLLILYRTIRHDQYPFIMLTKESYDQIYKDFSEAGAEEDILSVLKLMYTFCPAGSPLNIDLKERFLKLFPKLGKMDMYLKRTLSTREPPIRDMIIQYSSVSPQQLRRDYENAGNFDGKFGNSPGFCSEFVIFPLEVFLYEDKITITLNKSDIIISKYAEKDIGESLSKAIYSLGFDFKDIEFVLSE